MDSSLASVSSQERDGEGREALAMHRAVRDSSLSSAAKLVLLVLITRSLRHGKHHKGPVGRRTCYPSEETIARDASLSVATVKRTLACLGRDAGRLRVTWERHNPNLYSVEWADEPPVPTEPIGIAHSELIE